MNLMDAINSKKPFRRSDFLKGWYWWTDGGRVVAGIYPKVAEQWAETGINFTVSDLQSTAYVVREEPKVVPVTMQSFCAAVVEVQKEYGIVMTGAFRLAQKLGL